MKHIYMMGDSTMQYNNYNTYPQCGWGQMLNIFAHEDVVIIDKAVNGRSTKSFKDEGRFDDILNKLEEGDFVICQFGHNDEKSQDPARYTTPNGTYLENLLYFYNEVTKRKCGFVLATSISRLKFENGKCTDTHKGYPQAMLEFAQKHSIDCVDLNQITLDHYNEIGQENAKRYHMIFEANRFSNFPEGKNDTSHLTYEGAHMVCQFFVENLEKTSSPLKNWFYSVNEHAKVDQAMLKD